ncbi:AEG_G0016800.mRNA.1.CDS.1 [Saccharomyces cerevisiae]|nr:AEG_G0016800.mRNA.1.CDS.1 [Saccharomyces cerevisiae]CAI6642098.1 AEG_G0016800.mRNA.1.CDS.1 [Saccharomyces cerevisiae]
MPYSPSLVFRDRSYAHGCYSIYHLKLTLLSHSTPSPISHHQYQMHSHHYARQFASAVYTLCHVPIKSIIIHILISISHSAAQILYNSS